jgi:hypothetical protein
MLIGTNANGLGAVSVSTGENVAEDGVEAPAKDELTGTKKLGGAAADG